MKQIEETQKEKSRALVVIQDDEGFDWGDFFPDEDAVGFALMELQQSQRTTERGLWHKE
ncbi:hypothetical protein Hanom_Chr04g00335781 [Helianthus anomalus]